MPRSPRVYTLIVVCLLAPIAAFGQSADRNGRISGFVTGSFGDGGPAPTIGLTAGYPLTPAIRVELDALGRTESRLRPVLQLPTRQSMRCGRQLSVHAARGGSLPGGKRGVRASMERSPGPPVRPRRRGRGAHTTNGALRIVFPQATDVDVDRTATHGWSGR